MSGANTKVAAGRDFTGVSLISFHRHSLHQTYPTIPLHYKQGFGDQHAGEVVPGSPLNVQTVLRSQILSLCRTNHRDSLYREYQNSRLIW